MSIPFIGKRYTPEQFNGFVQLLKTGKTNMQWKWDFVVLHHTSSPSLEQRPNGFTDQHLQNLLDFYEEKGWSGGPHLFVDDRSDGIILFQRLDRKGIHAASFNEGGVGIEMLGDYDREDILTGRGKKVAINACHAINALMGFNDQNPADRDGKQLRFHREEAKAIRDGKTCPGDNVSKQWIFDLCVELAAKGKPEMPDRVTSDSQTVTTAPEWEEAKALGLIRGDDPKGVATREMLAIVSVRLYGLLKKES